MKTIRTLLLTILIFPMLAQASFAVVQFGTAANSITVGDSDEHYLRYVRYMTVSLDKRTGADWITDEEINLKTPIERKTIVENLKLLENPIQREIFDKMNASTEVFIFADAELATNRIKQRIEILRLMLEFNGDDDLRYNYATVKEPARTNASLWTKTTHHNFLFRQKDGTPYEAISQLCAPTTKTYGECLGAIITCVWWGSSRVMGEQRFNNYYIGKSGVNSTEVLNMAEEESGSPFYNTRKATDTNTYIPGDWGYWKNYNYDVVVSKQYVRVLGILVPVSPYYDKNWLEKNDTKKIYYWSGENSLYLGGNLFFGLGVSPRTGAMMRERLRTVYNEDLKDVIEGLRPTGGFDSKNPFLEGKKVEFLYPGPKAEDWIPPVDGPTDDDLPTKLTFVDIKRPW
ncbi:hypothetical protein IAD21_04408 [Abditibacteriota bacterium]|nr:hypothetical protein IAD21_04408 [Abditibacteriota bacterium]